MRVDRFDYHLPQELIAQTPLKRRDSSRLLVVDRTEGTVSHRSFPDVLGFLGEGDGLVLNNTRVMPARLLGRRETGGNVEVLLLSEREKDVWEALVRPGRKIKTGDRLCFGQDGQLVGLVRDRTNFGGRVIEFTCPGDFKEVLEDLGEVPLPPYIKAPLKEPERYQTVYAGAWGSAAAPTAGLHFTHSLLEKVKEKGTQIVTVTLNVGLGTFRPVKEDAVEDHVMHEELVTVTSKQAGKINDVKGEGGRIFAVGTTVVRTLESASTPDGVIHPFCGPTRLFIYPGYEFKATDGLLTNFHLPRSTLLMMVCAFGGYDLIMGAYREAIREKYRFYSFGDAMLII